MATDPPTDDGTDSNGGEIRLSADSFTVSASEKVSTGEYENYNPHATIEGTIEGVDQLDDQTRRMLRGRLLEIHRDLQETLEQAVNNRIAIRDDENWEVK